MNRAFLMLALVVVVFVVIYARPSGPVENTAVKPVSESESPDATQRALEHPMDRKASSEDSSQEGDALDQQLAKDTIEPGVINIGPAMDPDDPLSWPEPESTEVINIGEPMDPDDPSTWPMSESDEVVYVGAPMDPDDPSTWPQSDRAEVINIGEPMNPDDPSTWPPSESSEVINIGQRIDPDNPY